MKKYDEKKMRTRELKKKLEMDLEKILEEHEETESVEVEWIKIEKALRENADKWFQGKSRRKTDKDWFDEECENALRKRNKARIEAMKNTEGSKEKYEKERRIAKQVCRKKKREYWEGRVRKVEDRMVNKEIRNFYQEVK